MSAPKFSIAQLMNGAPLIQIDYVGVNLMSHRGNLILVDESGYTVHKCHCALTLLQLIFWGSEFVISYIKQHEPTNHWYDLVDDEGSVLIDIHHKVIILHGGEYISRNIPRRRLYLELMSYVWDGWEIRWAYQGVFDMLDYLNLPRQTLDYKSTYRLDDSYLESLDEDGLSDEWPDAVISIRFVNNDVIVQYAIDTYEVLQFGKKLIDKLHDVGKLTELTWKDHDPEFPIQGVHIDVPRKHVYFWSSWSIPHPDEYQRTWRRWKLTWLKDNFEKHIELTDNRLKLPIPSNEVILQHLRAYLLQKTSLEEHRAAAEDTFEPFTSHNIEVPHYSAYYVDKLPPIEERTKIFNRAVDEWRVSN